MNVAIIGGGSIGLLLGYYFTKNVGPTTLYVRRREQADMLNRSGLKLSKNGTVRDIKVRAEVLQETGKIAADLVVVAVKQYDLEGLAGIFQTRISEDAKLLFVQNGMGHVPFMETLQQSDIYVGIVEHGALKNGEHKVGHTGQGLMKLAAFRGSLEATASVWDKLANEEFPIEYHEDWYTMMAEKLLINAAVNPLTALYRVENGTLLEREGFRRNMRRLFDEAIDVLGLDDKEGHWKKVLEICRRTAKNRSSMLRDIEMGRPTEINAISGYILEGAKTEHLSLPYTLFVYDSIKSLSLDPS